MIAQESQGMSGYSHEAQFKPRYTEQTLKSGQIQVERKQFSLHLGENHLGQFVRITEMNNHHRNTIIVPAAGLAELIKILSEMAEESNARAARGDVSGTDSKG